LKINFLFINLLQNDPIVLGPTEYACPFCNKIQKTNAHMQRHIRTHTGETPFACNYCNYSANRKDNLIRHIQSKHSEIQTGPI